MGNGYIRATRDLLVSELFVQIFVNESNCFTNRFGQFLAEVLKNYGGYIVEDSYDWGDQGAWGLTLESGVAQEVMTKLGISLGGNGTGSAYCRDVNKITSNLHVVTSNGSSSIGGGPTTETAYPSQRLKPLLPSCGTQNRPLIPIAVNGAPAANAGAEQAINVPNNAGPGTTKINLPFNCSYFAEIYTADGTLECVMRGDRPQVWMPLVKKRGVYVVKISSGGKTLVRSVIKL